MADKKYTSKATVRSIKFTSRVSTKIKEVYYTVEACEERLLPENLNKTEVEQERKLLWDSVNEQVDNQIIDIYKQNK